MASASDHERHDYFPERSDDILNPQSQYIPNHQNDVEGTISSSSDDSIDPDSTLEPVETNETARERQFESIRAGDREQLERIASGFGGSQLGRTFTNATAGTHELEKKDTLYGVKLGDSTLDPSSPDFDVYKWAKM